MKKAVWVYDAFTHEVMKGNPAGVVLDGTGLTRNQMMDIAGELRHSETAFLTGSAQEGWRVRFFTPSQEVDLCGHATIAYVTAMVEEGMVPLEEGESKLEIQTNLGKLPVWIYGAEGRLERVMMLQDRPQIQRKSLPEKEIAGALGLGLQDLSLEMPLVKAYTGLWDLMIPVATPDSFQKIKPDFEKMVKLSQELDIISFHPFVLKKDTAKDAVFARVRNFAPIVAIPEESATGTSNGALGAFLVQEGILPTGKTVTMEQGVEMSRRSLIQVRVEEGKEGRLQVYVGGKAKRFLKGELWL